MDSHGNYILEIGSSRTLFAAHIDTADRQMTKVRRVVKGDYVSTDGATILGADNRSGIVILLHLIRNKVPGKYVFFVGEESGRIGSTFAAKDGIADGMDRVVCWDRYGETSIITHQMGERSCSDDFTNALVGEYKRFGVVLAPDNGGAYTDSYSFIDEVPECTNISIGYYNQHTTSETQDVRFLMEMAEASVLVDWEGLPVSRDPFSVEQRPPWKYADSYWGPKSTYEGYSNVDDLVQEAQWGTLRKDAVEDFLWENPKESAELLYDLLMGVNVHG